MGLANYYDCAMAAFCRSPAFSSYAVSYLGQQDIVPKEKQLSLFTKGKTCSRGCL